MNAPSLESRRAGGRAASRPPPGRLFCKREQAGRFYYPERGGLDQGLLNALECQGRDRQIALPPRVLDLALRARARGTLPVLYWPFCQAYKACRTQFCLNSCQRNGSGEGAPRG